MAKIIATVKSFIAAYQDTTLLQQSTEITVERVSDSGEFKSLILSLLETDVYAPELGQAFAETGAIQGLAACRKLRSGLNFSLKQFFTLLGELIAAFDLAAGLKWSAFAGSLYQAEIGNEKLLHCLLRGKQGDFYEALAMQLVETNPHAIYPTSCYRESAAHVVSSSDDKSIEAVMSSTTFTSIKLVDNVLDFEQPILKDTYLPLGRCVCLVDQNVENYYGEQIEQYFSHHGISLDKLVYRAMEVDKGIQTVERMLGDFKRLGVSRNEPVLIIGGGVLTDTGGLACALYHRNTPYVMLSTSIVAGIDAGPSPRTCCDGFGYKNLFGAYHAPILSLTDRSFFKTLREGWLRHGIAEIIKMATVKNEALFCYLEQAGPALIETRFGTLNCEPGDETSNLSQKILGAALRSYVEAEYDNLYETHQCRPHAYGHTWSPGFEIEAGLLHGHAVAIGMGFGAYLSHRVNWISADEFHRILRLISSFGLSLWHDVMLNKSTLWAAQEKIVQKRGGNLAAPIPKNGIGHCGYLNTLTRDDLELAIAEYRAICGKYPRQGRGIEPLCSDVGLEDPSTVGQHTPIEMVTSNGNGNGKSSGIVPTY